MPLDLVPSLRLQGMLFHLKPEPQPAEHDVLRPAEHDVLRRRNTRVLGLLESVLDHQVPMTHADHLPPLLR